MKEHFQDYGARKWAGDDLIELQSEPLAALQALVSPYAPCIVSGCETHADDGGGYTVSAGLVALPGKDVKGNDCVKIVRTDSIAMADNNQVCYLTLQHQTLTRTYGDGTSKAIAYNYVAQQTTIKPEDAPYLEIAANGGQRLVDTLGITQKLDREGGDATDVKVTFAEPSADQEPGTLQSGTKLGTLISQIKGWLSALKKELGNKVDKEQDKVLSSNDFTDELKEKLKGISKNANNFTYTHPTGNGNNHIPAGGEEGQYLKYSASGTATWKKPTASEIGAAANGHTHTLASLGAAASSHSHSWSSITSKPATFSPSTHSHDAATSSVAGFMSVADKTKLNGIASGANNYSHPTGNGNNHIPKDGSSGQYLKYSSTGTAQWASHCNFVGKISGALSLEPGMVGNLSTDATITIKATTESQLKTNPVAYVGNSGYKKLTFTKSGVTLIHSNSTKGKSGVAATGLWRFTWVSTIAVFVEFFGCDSYTE